MPPQWSGGSPAPPAKKTKLSKPASPSAATAAALPEPVAQQAALQAPDLALPGPTVDLEAALGELLGDEDAPAAEEPPAAAVKPAPTGAPPAPQPAAEASAPAELLQRDGVSALSLAGMPSCGSISPMAVAPATSATPQAAVLATAATPVAPASAAPTASAAHRPLPTTSPLPPPPTTTCPPPPAEPAAPAPTADTPASVPAIAAAAASGGSRAGGGGCERAIEAPTHVNLLKGVGGLACFLCWWVLDGRHDPQPHVGAAPPACPHPCLLSAVPPLPLQGIDMGWEGEGGDSPAAASCADGGWSSSSPSEVRVGWWQGAHAGSGREEFQQGAFCITPPALPPAHPQGACPSPQLARDPSLDPELLLAVRRPSAICDYDSEPGGDGRGWGV